MKITGLRKSYDGKTVLNIEALELEKGLIYAVIGANGCGKSTMAKLISGVLKSDDKIGFSEKVSIGYLPQKPYGFNMSLEKNMNIAGTDTARRDELLSLLKIDELKNENAKKLSGGELSRMALARVMMRDCDLLILDEPTASMDVESTLLAEDAVRAYVERTGATVIVITHELNEAKRLSDRVIYLEKGELVEIGERDKALSSPADERTRRYIEFYK